MLKTGLRMNFIGNLVDSKTNSMKMQGLKTACYRWPIGCLMAGFLPENPVFKRAFLFD
jgi:hypothetical protein